MGILGKDLLDYSRPLSHTKIQFGESAYWIERDPTPHPYGEALTDLLNYDPQVMVPVGDGTIFDKSRWDAEEVTAIQDRYSRFLTDLFRGAAFEKKKGQRKNG